MKIEFIYVSADKNNKRYWCHALMLSIFFDSKTANKSHAHKLQLKIRVLKYNSLKKNHLKQ